MTDIEAVVERCCDAAWSQNYSMPRRKPRMMRALAALQPGDPLPGGNVVAQGWASPKTMPINGTPILICRDDRCVMEAWWWGGKVLSDGSSTGTDLNRVRAWQPMPAPPTPEASDV